MIAEASWLFDDNSNLLRSEGHTNSDSIPEQLWLYKYDDRNNKIEDKLDRNGDGVWNRIYSYDYKHL